MQSLDIEYCHAPWASLIQIASKEYGDLLRDPAAGQLLVWGPSCQQHKIEYEASQG